MSATTATESFEIPKKYKAAVFDKPGEISIKLEELETPEPGLDEVLVRLTHSGVCHSDLSLMTNSWRTLPFPIQAGQVGGHEGVGIVHKLGPGAEKSKIKVGDRVGIKWVAEICGRCPACRENVDGLCFNQKISGYYHPGTFQQYALGPANYVTPIPEGLSSEEAAPMLCAGLTCYAALRKAETKSGQWVVVSGAGGGLGHLAVQLGSRGMAYRIIGIDHGSKEKLVLECGAEAFIDITKFDDKTIGEEVKRITGGLGASSVIVCTGSNKGYAQALDFLRFGGTIVCVGLPEGDLVPIASAAPGRIAVNQYRIVGSAIGNQREALEVLDFAARGIVKTRVRLEKLDKLGEVFHELHDGKLQGRVVIDLE